MGVKVNTIFRCGYNGPIQEIGGGAYVQDQRFKRGSGFKPSGHRKSNKNHTTAV